MNGNELQLRPAVKADMTRVAEIWAASWPDGHLGGVPDELAAVRTPESFHRRAAERAPDTTVATINGQIAGFTMVVGDEVEQCYVAAEHRGRGLADLLLKEAERQIAQRGHQEAWLAVVPANARARAFYSRCGWVDRGLVIYQADAEGQLIDVPVHRYTKQLSSRKP